MSKSSRDIEMERTPKIGKGHGLQAYAPQTHHTGLDDPDATAGLTPRRSRDSRPLIVNLNLQ